MIDKEMARELVQKDLEQSSTEPAQMIVILDRVERPWGWVFEYQSRAYLETNDFRHALIGNAPYFVNRNDSSIRQFGTDQFLEEQIARYEQLLLKPQCACQYSSSRLQQTEHLSDEPKAIDLPMLARIRLFRISEGGRELPMVPPHFECHITSDNGYSNVRILLNDVGQVFAGETFEAPVYYLDQEPFGSISQTSVSFICDGNPIGQWKVIRTLRADERQNA
jgi:hypothetical protein